MDVSTYGPVKFEAETREKCDTVFNKRCETKTDQVGILTFLYSGNQIVHCELGKKVLLGFLQFRVCPCKKKP